MEGSAAVGSDDAPAPPDLSGAGLLEATPPWAPASTRAEPHSGTGWGVTWAAA